MWETKDILICIKTYPEYSKKYDETVCTAGIRKDTGGFIRLYPVPYRYLDGEKQFKKYQWIQASIEKSSDGRPESHKVIASTIKTGAVIGPEREWAERRRWVLTPGNVYSSMKEA